MDESNLKPNWLKTEFRESGSGAINIAWVRLDKIVEVKVVPRENQSSNFNVMVVLENGSSHYFAESIASKTGEAMLIEILEAVDAKLNSMCP